MKAPKEIVECVEKYEKLRKEYERIEKEMEECKRIFAEWEGDTGVYIGHLFIAISQMAAHRDMENIAISISSEMIGIRAFTTIRSKGVINMSPMTMNVKLRFRGGTKCLR